MTGNITFAKEKEFTNNKNELVQGWDLVFQDEETGESRKFFVSNDNLKGFDPKLISTLKGPRVEVSLNIKSYQGKDRIVLDKIIQLS